MPPGGAFDPELAACLNALVGNSADALCLELALTSATFEFASPAFFAHDGATCAVRVGAGTVASSTVALVSPGEKLVVEPPPSGVRVWLAVAGGFVGTAGTRIVSGDNLEIGTAGPRSAVQRRAVPTTFSGPLSVVPGDDRFREALDGTYTVSHASDRIGIRLDGGKLTHQLELPSRPATVGTIQLTPPGQLIILGPDGPTIGGYPQVGTVINSQLAALAQLRPGDEVTFRTAGPSR